MTLAVCIVSPGLSAAQEDRPQIRPDERKVPRKKEAGPRALAVLRLTASGKATLVPITILMSGKFYDASAYKATPVPMALESGTVYEGVRTGSSLGLFTVDGALHSTTANSQSPWIGTGQWLAAGAAEKKTTLKAEDVPVGMETSDGPPRLSRGGNGSGATPPATTPPASTTPPTTPPATTTPPSTAPQNPPAGSSQPSPGSTAPAGGSKPANGDDHPKDSKPADNHTADAPRESDNNSGAGDSNRPRLRRGKPVDPLPDEEVPGYARPGAKASTAAPTVPTAPTGDAGKTTPPALVPVQLIPAISDASGPQPRPFTFEWLKSEEGERRQQLTDFAKQQVRAYVDTLIKNRIVAKPLPQAARRKSSKPAEPILEDVHMIAYDLWTNNQPIMIFSAQAHMPPTGSDPQAVADAETQYSIVIVARTDIYNNLHKLFLAVTDKNHLDITPRLELVDAVDVDGDNRGELLFRETSDAGGGWLIYRVTNDKLWKLFDSLNPE